MTARKLTSRAVITPSGWVPGGSTGGVYSGAELKPYQGRPGAMDAFRLPSRIGSRLVEPRAVREGLL